jgi:hypothetical protein
MSDWAVAVGAVAVGAAMYYAYRTPARPVPRAQPSAAASKQPAATLTSQLHDHRFKQWAIVIVSSAIGQFNGGAFSADEADVAVAQQLVSGGRAIVIHRCASAAAAALAEEKAAVSRFFAEKLGRPGTFARHQLVFCTSVKGVEAIARQVHPTLFVGTDQEQCLFLKKFLSYVVTVGGAGEHSYAALRLVPVAKA